MMDAKLYECVKNHDLRGTIEKMILPSSRFVGPSIPYDCDWDGETIDSENLLIKLSHYMETMFELDEYTDIVNEVIQEVGDCTDDIFDRLREMGHEIITADDEYTYNYEHDLDRDFAYTIFAINDGNFYAIVDVHCGADARAGFSDSVCFAITDYDYFHLAMIIESDFEIDGYITDEAYQGSYEIDNNAEYNHDKGVWIDNESGDVLRLTTLAQGF